MFSRNMQPTHRTSVPVPVLYVSSNLKAITQNGMKVPRSEGTGVTILNFFSVFFVLKVKGQVS